MAGAKIKEFVNREPVVLHVDSTIRDAARLMSEKNVGLVVLVERERPRIPVGVVSERDIVRAVARGEPLDSNVKSVANTRLITVDLEDDVGTAAAKLLSNYVRHLVVLDESRRLVGVLSIRDVVREQSELLARAQEAEKEGEIQGD